MLGARKDAIAECSVECSQDQLRTRRGISRPRETLMKEISCCFKESTLSLKGVFSSQNNGPSELIIV